jgi:ubiquinone/menaquinone biosynthesis C-methylase UbiE
MDKRNGHKGRPTSFWMHNPEVIFKELKLSDGGCFLDIGCGMGDYSIYAAKIIGDSGTVYALDRVEKLIEELREKTLALGLSNIKAIAADITSPLPVKDGCVDVCLVATVLHATGLAKGKELFREIHRVLKPSGRMVTIDCSKKDDSFGPPMEMRLSPEDIEAAATQCGFEKIGRLDLGFNYMIQFAVGKGIS